ncbi:MAG: hypothetical protein ACFCUE_13690 [Candidatus Bathyarchaeia archaeon]|jgi:uncharacterized protein YoxC
MAEMKIVLLTGILCIIVGLGIIIGGAVAIPYINSSIDSIQTTASNYLAQAHDAITNAVDAINSTQVTLIYLTSATNLSLPQLGNSSQLTSTIANNLTAVSSTVSTVGQTLAGISVAGSMPFVSVGNTISSLSNPIQTAASTLLNVSDSISSIQQQARDLPNRIETITIQLDNVRTSLSNLRGSIVQLQEDLPSYFNQIRLVALLAVAGVMGLGAIFLLIGISLLSLRHNTIKNGNALYKIYSNNPSLNT